MTSDLLVRLANPDDARAIAQLLRGVFAETYGHAISHDALQRYLDTAFSEEAIAHSGTAHLLAFCNDDLAGVSELTLSQPPTCVPTDAVEVSRFYVHSDYRGSGAADALLAACEHHASERGHRTLWLCVWESNPRAVAFYRKHGFAQIGAMDIVIEDTVFHDLVMMKQIPANAPNPRPSPPSHTNPSNPRRG